METEKEQELWKLAKKRVGFKKNLASYIVINSMFWVLWYFTEYQEENGGGVPWPVFPMIGWGIGIVFGFIKAYVNINPDAVEKEYEKLKDK